MLLRRRSTPVQLVEVQDLHRERARRYSALDVVGHPRRSRSARARRRAPCAPEPRAQLRVARERREPSASASMSPIGSR